MDASLRHYLIVTGSYWAFTLTDGAIRMLVVLYFHLLGYSPLEVAMLFLFYEFFGIVTNLVGGWLGARIGLNLTMQIGLTLQIIALSMLMVPDAYLSVVYVMLAQAISGIAKDLNKMSAKASIKSLIPKQQGDQKLFKWIALLTGSKNTLKGVGFFLGAGLLQWLSFRGALGVLSLMLLVVLIISIIMLPNAMAKTQTKNKFIQIFSNTPAVNYLSLARFFLFAARDIWFVVALPVYLYTVFNWSFMQVGGFLASWIIAYGIVQASAPKLLSLLHLQQSADALMSKFWILILMLVPAGIAISLIYSINPEFVLLVGLLVFGIVFAINSALHSFLIVAWADNDKVAMNVGFYYMANAAGRLLGTVLSGWMYQSYGLVGCLLVSSLLLLAAWFTSSILVKYQALSQ